MLKVLLNSSLKIHHFPGWPYSTSDEISCFTCLVFQKKDLYLVITQKLTKLYIKTIVVFMKSGGFCENLQSLWKPEKWKAHWKATKTADSTQMSHFDLVFHRIQREGQLCISYVLVVFGGDMCIWWCMHVHIYMYL